MYYFTADEHYFHRNIIRFCGRPFSSVKEMNEEMIENHNRVVKDSSDNITIHAGDFSFGSTEQTKNIIKKLNGIHIFLHGSHDKWGAMRKRKQIWEKRIGKGKQMVVVCHYAMKTWHCSHWNSWHLFGHSHGGLNHEGKTMDVGVDTNNFKPYSFEEIKNIMKDKPNNFNFIKRKDK